MGPPMEALKNPSASLAGRAKVEGLGCKHSFGLGDHRFYRKDFLGFD